MSPGGGEAAPQPSMAREAAATSSSRPGRLPAAPLLRAPIRGCGPRAVSTPAPVPATAARRESARPLSDRATPTSARTRTSPLVCYLDEDEMRAASEPDFRRGTAVDLHRPSRRWPQLEPVESLAEDGQVAERARARLILVGEGLGREAARYAERGTCNQRRDRRRRRLPRSARPTVSGLHSAASTPPATRVQARGRCTTTGSAVAEHRIYERIIRTFARAASGSRRRSAPAESPARRRWRRRPPTSGACCTSRA